MAVALHMHGFGESGAPRLCTILVHTGATFPGNHNVSGNSDGAMYRSQGRYNAAMNEA